MYVRMYRCTSLKETNGDRGKGDRNEMNVPIFRHRQQRWYVQAQAFAEVFLDTKVQQGPVDVAAADIPDKRSLDHGLHFVFALHQLDENILPEVKFLIWHCHFPFHNHLLHALVVLRVRERYRKRVAFTQPCNDNARCTDGITHCAVNMATYKRTVGLPLSLLLRGSRLLHNTARAACLRSADL